MNEPLERISDNCRQKQAETDTDQAASADAPPVSSRRAMLSGSAKKLAYAAPLALLFRPKQAMAASQSNS